MHPVSRRSGFNAVLVGGWLCLQLGIPLWQLQSPRPARFGWQMFSGLRQPLLYSVTRQDGSTYVANLQPHIGVYRGDLDGAVGAIRERLCSADPSAVRVSYHVPLAPAATEHACLR